MSGGVRDVADAPERERYESTEDGELLGFAQYRLRPGLIAFVHTVVESRAEGRGVGSELVQRPRMTGSLEASRWVVAARERAGVPQAEALLRRLRVAHMRGALIDEPGVLAATADEARERLREVAVEDRIGPEGLWTLR